MQFILTFVIWGWRFYTINAPCAHQTETALMKVTVKIFSLVESLMVMIDRSVLLEKVD